MNNFLATFLLLIVKKYLASVIQPIRELVDDLIIVDSGSVDKTEGIAKKFGAKFIVRRVVSANNVGLL